MIRKLLLFTGLFVVLINNIEALPKDNNEVNYKNAISETQKGNVERVKAIYDYGVWLDENNRVNDSVDQLKEALHTAREIENYQWVASISNYLGSVLWEIGDYKGSTDVYQVGLESVMKTENRELLSTLQINISGNYNSEGKPTLAIEHALSAIKIREEDKRLDDICFDYMTVAEIFKEIGDTVKWEEYTQKAYRLINVDRCASFDAVIMLYNNLGQIFHEKGAYDQALMYYDTLKIKSEKEEHDQGVGIALINSALVYQDKKEQAKALEMVSQSIPYFGEVPYFLMASEITKADLLKELKNYTEALTIAESCIDNEHIQYYPTLKTDCLKLLVSLNKDLGNYKQAFCWVDSLNAHKEILNKETHLRNIEDLEAKYETEKKEQQIELLSAENKIKTQRNELFVAISVSLFLVLVLGTLLYYRRKKQNEQKQEQLRQQLLRSQMNPHFLFNALGSIQSFMLRNETKKAAGYLGNFASLTRSILEHSATEIITLDEEIRSLTNYIELEKMRMNNSFEYSFDYSEDLETDFINIPPMLIQPFVENAIKHGLKGIDYIGKISIAFEDRNELLKVIVSDNGKGFDINNASNENHHSMALDIFKKRIKLFKKEHRKDIHFSINSEVNKGTEVTLEIPVLE